MTWSASPVIFDIGIVQLRWYGLLFASSFYFGFLILKQICIKEKIDPIHADRALMCMIISVLVGARLGYCLFYNPDFYLSNPIRVLYIWKGGLSSHGATIGIFLGMFIYSKLYKVNYFWILDRLSMSIALSATLIRIGNFFNSEILGKPTSVSWGVIFKRVDDIKRHPTQLYESFTYLLCFILLIFIYKKYKYKPPEKLLLGSLLTWIFSFRILIEFTKESQSDFADLTLMYLGLNMGQILSIPVILIGIFLIFKSFKNG